MADNINKTSGGNVYKHDPNKMPGQSILRNNQGKPRDVEKKKVMIGENPVDSVKNYTIDTGNKMTGKSSTAKTGTRGIISAADEEGEATKFAFSKELGVIRKDFSKMYVLDKLILSGNAINVVYDTAPPEIGPKGVKDTRKTYERDRETTRLDVADPEKTVGDKLKALLGMEEEKDPNAPLSPDKQFVDSFREVYENKLKSQFDSYFDSQVGDHYNGKSLDQLSEEEAAEWASMKQDALAEEQAGASSISAAIKNGALRDLSNGRYRLQLTSNEAISFTMRR